MKRLVIVSEGKNTGASLLKQLNDLLGDYLNIDNLLVSQLSSETVQADLILFTTEHVKTRALKFIDHNISNLVAKRVIDHKNIKEIISIEEGKDVLVINDAYDTTMEAIEQMTELGLNHIKYHPYYPDCNSYPQLEIAITPGESQIAPYNPGQLIDIGCRILDIKSIHELVAILGIEEYLKNSLVKDYIRDIIEISKSIEESRRASQESKQILEMIVNSLEYGIAFFNNDGKIVNFNSKFEYIFGIRKKDLLGRKFEELFPNCINLKENKSITIQVESKEVEVQIREVNFSRKIGYIVSVKHSDKSSRLISKTGNPDDKFINRKLHNFSDYYTVNKDVMQILKRAKKFARTESTILIVGENGTGKEILAQGIHMNSYRSKNAFVPINIATISSNLVEAELFGYEEGTFTGAIKGGKMGIFEIADGGTIFIDEIGDTPLDVQAKLLRVLEEKRVRRIGAADEIPIDVRIIAATNKDLLSLVNENRFRLDLFFRLNILPLNTIPLRKRKEDIEYLLKYFINVNLIDKKIETLNEFFHEETITFLDNYQWKGNVRELINLVEYLVLIYEGEKMKLSSLHSYMLDDSSSGRDVILDTSELWVLKQFNKYDEIPIGRTKITEIAKNENYEIGEGKIRRIIKHLEHLNLTQFKDNMGSTITEKGKKVLEEYK